MSSDEPRIKRTVLCFVFDDTRTTLLMIRKKRGQGAGKVNVPGGKVRPGETAEEAAVRETAEETGIRPEGLKEVGRLEFRFPEGQSWDNSCVVFQAGSFSGSLMPDTDECSAYWEGLGSIPFEKMWSSDRLWLPLLLSGKRFHKAYVFGAHDEVLEERELKPQAGPG